jgi:hypothetical protein
VFSLKSDVCLFLVLILLVSFVCRVVTAPRDAWTGFRRFFRFRDLEIGMESPVTAVMIIGGGLMLFGLILWVVGWAIGSPVILAIGVTQYVIVFPFLVGYLWIVLICSILRDMFRPLRPKHPNLVDRTKAYGKSWEFTKRGNLRTPGFVRPPELPSIIPLSRFGRPR